MPSAFNRFRAILWSIHRWIGLLLLIVLVPVGLSGAFLVFDQEIDALLHPSRYAATGPATLAPSEYLSSASKALEGRAQPMAIRYPGEDGGPVIVQARGGAREGGPPRFLSVYMDPPTGQVLDVADFRSSLVGLVHRFHENLTIPEYSGRAIVGWSGVAMLILSLSGIVLWWPRNGAFLRGLRWRRSPTMSNNLHHIIGFWISLPLALVSLTGIYLAFPPQARSLMAAIAPMTPQGPRGPFGMPARHTALTADRALELARAAAPAARPAAILLPVAGGRDAAQGPPPVWRVQLRTTSGDTTVLVDDRSGEARPQPAPLSGDAAAQWIRWLHEGSHSGTVWRLVVLLTGLAPTLFSVTGVIMWLRYRRRRKALTAMAPGVFQAAE